jgi:hypothetical protein
MAVSKKFRATLQTDDESAFTYIVVPFNAQTVFGRGRPPVRVTVNGYAYRSTLAPYGSEYYLAVNQAVRSGARVQVGDRVTVIMEADEAPRPIKAPTDLTRALKASPPAQTRWKELSYTHQKEYVTAIEDAKRPETRARRIERTVERLAGEHQTRSDLT